jgi:hypothetical protein
VDIVAYMVAVFLRREPGCRPLAGIDTQARPIDILVIDDPLAVAGRDVVAARVIRNFDDFPEELVSLLLARARLSLKKVPVSVRRFPPTYRSSVAGVTWLKITTPIRRIRCR